MKIFDGFSLVSMVVISLSFPLVTALPTYSQIITPHIEGPPGDGEEQKGKKIIALLPERNVFAQRKRYLRLQNYLSKRLGIKIYYKILAKYPDIFSHLIKGVKEKKCPVPFLALDSHMQLLGSLNSFR